MRCILSMFPFAHQDKKVTRAAYRFMNRCILSIKSNGVESFVKIMKDNRLSYTRYICGQPLHRGALPGRRITGNHLCSWVDQLEYEIRKAGFNPFRDDDAARFIHSCTRLSNCVFLDGNPEVIQITGHDRSKTASLVRTFMTLGKHWEQCAPDNEREELHSLMAEIRKAVNLIGRPKPPSSLRPHASTKTGPNGLAMPSASSDAHLLLKTEEGRALLSNLECLAPGITEYVTDVASCSMAEDVLHRTTRPEFIPLCSELEQLCAQRVRYLDNLIFSFETFKRNNPNFKATEEHSILESMLKGEDEVIKSMKKQINSWKFYDRGINPYPCLRKLSTVSDIEGKCRVIAIFDYFSQMVLKPIHNSFMDHLREIPTDCTFNQGDS